MQTIMSIGAFLIAHEGLIATGFLCAFELYDVATGQSRFSAVINAIKGIPGAKDPGIGQ